MSAANVFDSMRKGMVLFFIGMRQRSFDSNRKAQSGTQNTWLA
jgi:hypothetical protein